MAMIYRHWFPCTVTPENPHGEGYTGRTDKDVEKRDRQRFLKPNDSKGLKESIEKYGEDNMQTDIIESGLLPILELVVEREEYWIAYFDDYHNGCNRAPSGGGGDPEVARETNRKRVARGDHNFLGSKNNLERVEDGTHHFLGGEIQRRRVKDGTHHLLRKNHPRARPEYEQARWFFLFDLHNETDIKQKRKRLYEAFPDIPKRTLRKWFRKWQAELENSKEA